MEQTQQPGPRILVWSDYIWPFCYVALERAAWLERRYGAQIEWLAFDLHPEYPPEGIPRHELERRYGSGFAAQVREMIEASGLPVSPDLELVPNSQRALAVAELARDRGVHGALHGRLFDAYWARGRDLGDDSVLVDEAAPVGLGADEVRAALDNPAYRERVTDQTVAAAELGAGGVPAWLIDERLLVPGAQPHEVFDRVLQRLGYEPRGD